MIKKVTKEIVKRTIFNLMKSQVEFTSNDIRKILNLDSKFSIARIIKSCLDDLYPYDWYHYIGERRLLHYVPRRYYINVIKNKLQCCYHSAIDLTLDEMREVIKKISDDVLIKLIVYSKPTLNIDKELVIKNNGGKISFTYYNDEARQIQIFMSNKWLKSETFRMSQIKEYISNKKLTDIQIKNLIKKINIDFIYNYKYSKNLDCYYLKSIREFDKTNNEKTNVIIRFVMFDDEKKQHYIDRIVIFLLKSGKKKIELQDVFELIDDDNKKIFSNSKISTMIKRSFQKLLPKQHTIRKKQNKNIYFVRKKRKDICSILDKFDKVKDKDKIKTKEKQNEKQNENFNSDILNVMIISLEEIANTINQTINKLKLIKKE